MPRTPVYGPEDEYYPQDEEDITEEEVAEASEPEKPGDLLAPTPDVEEKDFSEEDILQAEYNQLQEERETKGRTKELKRNIRRLKHPAIYGSGEAVKETGAKIASAGKGFLGGVKEYVLASGDKRAAKRERTTQRINMVKQQTQSLSGGLGSIGRSMLGQGSQGPGPLVSGPKQQLDLLSSGNNRLDLIGGGNTGLSLTGSNEKSKLDLSFGGGSGISLLGPSKGNGKGLSLLDEGMGSGLMSFGGPKTKTRNKGRKKRRRKR